MPPDSVARFVDSFFERMLFQPDDTVAAASFEELSPDATININGSALSASDLKTVITERFRGTQIGALLTIRDLNFAPLDPEGNTGVIAQITTYTITGKTDGKVVPQTATTLVKVEEQEGKRRVTSIYEVQSEG